MVSKSPNSDEEAETSNIMLSEDIEWNTDINLKPVARLKN